MQESGVTFKYVCKQHDYSHDYIFLGKCMVCSGDM